MEPKFLPAGAGRRLTVMGDQQVVRLTGADTNGQFALVEQANPPGVGIPMHAHAHEDELFQVLEGAVEMTVGGVTRRAEAGAAVWLPRNVPHAWTAVGLVVTRNLVFAFPAGIEGMFEELAALPPGPPDMARVVEVCGRYGITFLPPGQNA